MSATGAGIAAGSLVSIVVPARNDASTLVELHERLTRSLDEAGIDFEIIVVDDGSRDGTWEIVSSLASSDARVRGIRLSRGYGQGPAFFTGFRAARGGVIAVVEADLDIAPEGLVELIDRHRGGAELVSGSRRSGRSPQRAIPSRAFNAAIRRVAGIDLDDVGSAFLVMSRDLVEQADRHGAFRRNFMVKTLFAQIARSTAQVEVEVAPRASPTSYRWSSRVLGAIEALQAFGRPFVWVVIGGMALLGAGAAALVVLAALAVGGSGPPWTAAGVLAALVVAATGWVTVLVGAVANLILTRVQWLDTPFVSVAEEL